MVISSNKCFCVLIYLYKPGLGLIPTGKKNLSATAFAVPPPLAGEAYAEILF
jgi:hypothetical protein